MNHCSPAARAFARSDNDGAVVEYATVAALVLLVCIGVSTDTLAPDNVSGLVSGAAGYARSTLSTATTPALALSCVVLDGVFRLISSAVDYAMPVLASTAAFVVSLLSIAFDYALEYGSRILSTATAFVEGLLSLAR